MYPACIHAVQFRIVQYGIQDAVNILSNNTTYPPFNIDDGGYTILNYN